MSITAVIGLVSSKRCQLVHWLNTCEGSKDSVMVVTSEFLKIDTLEEGKH